MEEQPPDKEGAANILNKQPRTADKRLSSSLGIGRGVNSTSLEKKYNVTAYCTRLSNQEE